MIRIHVKKENTSKIKTVQYGTNANINTINETVRKSHES